MHPGRGILWAAASLACGACAAWLAFRAQAAFAPVVVFPLGAGAVLGAALLAVGTSCRPLPRTAILAGALAAGAVASIGQHYLSFRAARQLAIQRQQAVGTKVQGLAALAAAEMLKPPENFAAYMHSEAQREHVVAGLTLQGPWVWAWWALDAVLLTASAVLVSHLGSRGRPLEA